MTRSLNQAMLEDLVALVPAEGEAPDFVRSLVEKSVGAGWIGGATAMLELAASGVPATVLRAKLAELVQVTRAHL